jgi:hypothetical protein
MAEVPGGRLGSGVEEAPPGSPRPPSPSPQSTAPKSDFRHVSQHRQVSFGAVGFLAAAGPA